MSSSQLEKTSAYHLILQHSVYCHCILFHMHIIILITKSDSINILYCGIAFFSSTKLTQLQLAHIIHVFCGIKLVFLMRRHSCQLKENNDQDELLSRFSYLVLIPFLSYMCLYTCGQRKLYNKNILGHCSLMSDTSIRGKYLLGIDLRLHLSLSEAIVVIKNMLFKSWFRKHSKTRVKANFHDIVEQREKKII